MNRYISSIVATAAIGAALLLAGCAHTPAPVEVAECGEPANAGDTAVYAMLAPTGDALAAAQLDAKVVIDAAADDQTRLVVSSIGTTGPSMIVDTVMAGAGNNPLARTGDLECKQQGVADAVAELVAAPTDTSNVFGALSTFEGNIGTAAPVHIVILGGFAAPDALADPVATINQLAAAGLMPASCATWTFSIVGPDAADPAVKDFWLQYVAKCGGTLAAVTTRLSGFPAEGALTTSDRSQIAIDRAADVVTATVGGDVLFAYGESTLSPDAGPALDELLNLIESTPGNVQITGHTDARGTDHETLSRLRGEAVQAWLLAHHVDPARITPVRGAGAFEPVVPNAVSEADHAANRRVTVTITAP